MNGHLQNVNTDPNSSRRYAGNFLRIKHLRLLELISLGGSLAAAARELNLSQPAVTKMLHELEISFGRNLVTRGARGGRLTDEGAVVLQRLRLALAHFDTALTVAGEDGDGRRPLLRIGMLPVVAVSLLPALLRRLDASQRPLLEIHESTVGGLFKALVAGRIDCIVGRVDSDILTESAGYDLTVLPLMIEPLAIACAPGHKLARSARVTVEQLQGEDWIVAATGSETRRVFDSLFLNHGLMPPRPVVESMSFHTNLQMAGAMDALTIAPRSAVQFYQRTGVVQFLESRLKMPTGTISLIHLNSGADFPALQAFIVAAESGEKLRLTRGKVDATTRLR
ncbi:LysR substrate-binding domain-containing protein [Paraburkholderia domus]|uniref:LysR substrate-binding domain-containing protein n=1 Tax=Paraburkholderia domus TaxID=2793075 RepID=UPI001914C298|nr:LysR family transcriptional regulator [Paraburkholderia domus]MBK5185564.1 LysR family transcriptional regulator [Burkholderia sp. R-69749]CAE6881433.1 HTH-type transcriptional regulator GbpR [Paraburkholderia domus]